MLRRILGLVLLERSLRNSEQWKAVASQNEQMTKLVAQTATRMHNEEMLELQRHVLDILVGWRLSLETPEIDHREMLDRSIEELRDHLSRVEEHVA